MQAIFALSTPLAVAILLAIGQQWKASKERGQLEFIDAREPIEESERKKSGIGERHAERKSLTSDASQALSTAGDKSIETSKSLTKNLGGSINTEKERDLYKRLEELDRELMSIRAQLISKNTEETDGEIPTDAENDAEYSEIHPMNVLHKVRPGAIQAISEDDIPGI